MFENSPVTTLCRCSEFRLQAVPTPDRLKAELRTGVFGVFKQALKEWALLRGKSRRADLSFAAGFGAALTGTFFSLQLTNFPPLPTHPLGFPVYALGDAFVFDDLEFDWTAARAQGISLFGSPKYQSDAVQMAADGPPIPGEDEGGGGSATNNFPPAYNYTNGECSCRLIRRTQTG